MPTTEDLLRTGIGVLILLAATTAVLTVTGVPRRWSAASAILRGTLQLAALSLVLTGVISHPGWVALSLLVMFGAATFTSTGRLGWSPRRLGLVAGAMGAGVLVALAVVFATGAVALTSRSVLAIGGIVIGSAMATSTLAGRRLLQAAADRRGEIEGWLALGATPAQATAPIARHALTEALVPSTDQTRTTGLVTMPGAFVGAIFGGLSPLEAGRFQIVVLACIMAAAAITGAVIAFGLAPSTARARRSPRRSRDGGSGHRVRHQGFEPRTR